MSTLYQLCDSCAKLSNITALANWNVSNVTTMQYTFCMYGTTNPQLSDITAYFSPRKFSFSSILSSINVTNMISMFDSCTNLTNITALANWNVSNVTNMQWMFNNSLTHTKNRMTCACEKELVHHSNIANIVVTFKELIIRKLVIEK